MKPQWSPACAEAIGVPWLREALAPSGALGRRARERERTFRPGDEGAARAALTRVERVAQAHDLARLAALRATIGAAPDVGPLLARARAGGVLGEVDFFELGRFLDALAGIRALGPQAAGGADELPAVTLLHDQLAPGTSKARTFYLDDAFDPLLAAARGEAAACQAAYDAARSRLAERVARYAGLDAIPQREFVVMRDRMSGPLPPEIHVLRELPAYVLCEISLDAAALSALSARDAAAARVAELEERVRARLSAQVALEAEALERSCDALGEFDLVLARAQFAQRYGCTDPEVVESRTLAFTEARYLPLALALEQHGRRYAPISLDLAGIGVVTGPNMGGKTAALRTLGFLAACVALGVPVPAAAARLPLFDEIVWLGIGTAAEDDGLLSSFGCEVVAVRTFLAQRRVRPLVLIDEFARTTSPREGRALLIALLENLDERGALGLAATHLSHVTPAGSIAHFAIGGLLELPSREGAPLELEAALRRIAQAMDYRLQRVAHDADPPSDAIALADALGLDSDLIARAKERL